MPLRGRVARRPRSRPPGSVGAAGGQPQRPAASSRPARPPTPAPTSQDGSRRAATLTSTEPTAAPTTSRVSRCPRRPGRAPRRRAQSADSASGTTAARSARTTRPRDRAPTAPAPSGAAARRRHHRRTPSHAAANCRAVRRVEHHQARRAGGRRLGRAEHPDHHRRVRPAQRADAPQVVAAARPGQEDQRVAEPVLAQPGGRPRAARPSSPVSSAAASRSSGPRPRHRAGPRSVRADQLQQHRQVLATRRGDDRRGRLAGRLERLRHPGHPRGCAAARSSSRTTTRGRLVSTCSRTISSPTRAVVRQCTWRSSSPTTYSRSESNVMMPCGTLSTRPSRLRADAGRHRRQRVDPRVHPDRRRLAVRAGQRRPARAGRGGSPAAARPAPPRAVGRHRVADRGVPTRAAAAAAAPAPCASAAPVLGEQVRRPQPAGVAHGQRHPRRLAARHPVRVGRRLDATAGAARPRSADGAADAPRRPPRRAAASSG